MLKNIQIVKRFGPVGGMERYVWELSHALAKSGIEVHILCEKSFQSVDINNMHIHALGEIPAKPRWLSMLLFANKVKKWVTLNTDNDYIIHSHERTAVHHVTTFHSALFANIKQQAWWKRISIRVLVWLYLEKREVCNKQVQAVFPNSDLIKNQLKTMYPCIGSRLCSPAYPGIQANNNSGQPSKPDYPVIIFIGQEWQRKGLIKATLIVEALKKLIPEIEFWVLGPDPVEIQHLFDNWEKDYKLLGWQESKPFLSQASLLLHPADNEPYGMAIAEATELGVPVVISNLCGIANKITNHSGQVLELSSSIEPWVVACQTELNRSTPVKSVSQNWKDVAKQHIRVYKDLTL